MPNIREGLGWILIETISSVKKSWEKSFQRQYHEGELDYAKEKIKAMQVRGSGV